MDPSSASPPLAVDLAASCVEYVQRAVGVAPDYTPETLSLLDYYLEKAAEEGRKRPETLELVARVAAAYFGEVLCRRFACWWSIDGSDIASGLVRFGPVYLELSPYDLILDALGQPRDGATSAGFTVDPDDIEFIGAHLAALPPVSEEDFVKPTTRYDTLEIVVDQLKARAVARSLGDVLFEDPDYEDA